MNVIMIGYLGGIGDISRRDPYNVGRQEVMRAPKNVGDWKGLKKGHKIYGLLGRVWLPRV